MGVILPFPPSPLVVIEVETTRDRHRPDFDDAGREIGWTMVPTPPPGAGWSILDASSDKRTVWHRARRVEGRAGR